jgi:hypothetical protein
MHTCKQVQSSYETTKKTLLSNRMHFFCIKKFNKLLVHFYVSGSSQRAKALVKFSFDDDNKYSFVVVAAAAIQLY